MVGHEPDVVVNRNALQEPQANASRLLFNNKFMTKLSSYPENAVRNLDRRSQ